MDSQPGTQPDGASLPVIAVVAGPTATILNTPPMGADPAALVPQRLGEDVSIEVVDHSGHPIDEHLNSATGGALRKVTLARGQLVALPLPEGAGPAAQSFFPSAERLYEELDALWTDEAGHTGALGRLARYRHFRAGPPAGYTCGEAPEVLGVDFFPYGAWESRAEPDIGTLMTITNKVQEIVGAAEVAGVQWLEGSPVIEETLYWLGLLIDTDKPIVGQVAQRLHRSIGSDGGQNLVDGVRYIVSEAWNLDGRGDAVGAVLVADGVVRTARGAYKVAGRPGGYAGGGPVATCTTRWPIRLEYRPLRRHTRDSAVRISALPREVRALDGAGGSRPVRVTDSSGRLDPEVLPVVDIVVYGRYGIAGGACGCADLGVKDAVSHNVERHGLAGFVLEGIAPNGWASRAVESSLSAAVYSGFPVVWCGRGRPEDPVGRTPAPFVAGSNLGATKARMLLLACLLKFGAAPAAEDPNRPTAAEQRATAAYVRSLQEVFDTH
ncbi:asparaginase domain-containing protein [Dactylosporangium sp. NPDC000244]|uniref:asparaginase domain-containing protein n=1 Tax=Dactylosporangium sp. NPDC000244 TaxID=3154365 RepID=UPI0033171CFC